MIPLPDGLIAVVKRDCPTCRLVEPVLAQIAAETTLTVYTQDDLTFPSNVANVIDDTSLERSYHLQIEIVPTLIRAENGVETTRIVGWRRDEWRTFTGLESIGEGLPEMRPGCGSKSVEPGIIEQLAIRFGGSKL